MSMVREVFMAMSKQSRLTRHSMDIQSIFSDSGNVALILTISAIVMPILYFVCLYALAR
jgi:hypothetical protein